MRPLEVILVMLLVLSALSTMFGASGLLRRLLVLVGAAVLVLHLVLEGGHWQMLPAYMALLVAFVGALPGRRAEGGAAEKKTVGYFSACAVILLCAASVTASIVFPMFTLPKPTGPYAVGTRTLYLEDKSRNETAVADPAARRELVVQVWYPAEPSNNKLAIYRNRLETGLLNSYESVLRTNSRVDAPIRMEGAAFPVILFNHGWLGRRTLVTYLTEELASHGYVVASIDHPYVAGRVALSDGRVIDGRRSIMIDDPNSSTAALVQETWNTELDKWTADQVFVLNTLQQENTDAGSPWHGRLNTDLVGAFGHSFGGAASLQACGVDPRIRSAINIDGWTFGGLRYRNSDKPVMFIYGDLDSRRIDDPSVNQPPKNVEDQLFQRDVSFVVQSVARYGGYMINVTDTDHLDFTDQGLVTPIMALRRRAFTGPIKPVEIESIMRSYVLAFFDKTLRGKDSSLFDQTKKPPFPEVTFRAWAPGAKAAGQATASQSRATTP